MKGVGLSSRDIWTLAIVVVGVVVMWTSRRLSKEEDKDVPKAEERICSQRTNPERRRRIFSNSTNASLGFLPFGRRRRRRRRRREWCCACKTRAESLSKVPTNASFKERAMCCACVCATKSKVEENFENCFFFPFLNDFRVVL